MAKNKKDGFRPLSERIALPYAIKVISVLTGGKEMDVLSRFSYVKNSPFLEDSGWLCSCHGQNADDDVCTFAERKVKKEITFLFEELHKATVALSGHLVEGESFWTVTTVRVESTPFRKGCVVTFIGGNPVEVKDIPRRKPSAALLTMHPGLDQEE